MVAAVASSVASSTKSTKSTALYIRRGLERKVKEKGRAWRQSEVLALQEEVLGHRCGYILSKD